MRTEGLTEKEVVEARKKYGSNKIATAKRNTFIKLFIETLGDPIIKILIIALFIKIIFLFKDFDMFETFGILLSILIASFVSTLSEYGSEAAFKKLEEESSKIKVKVKRDKEIKEIDIEDIVVGDLVLLNSGDKVPADGVLIKGTMELDESAINGESTTKNKEVNEELYRGTIVTGGEGILKITKVGINTLYGSIAKELGEEIPVSPLRIRLTELAKNISKIGYMGALLVSLSYLFSKICIDNNFNFSLMLADITNMKLMFTYLLHALTLSVTLIVVSVPEGLPLMITLVLSSNMRRMLKNNVLVRKLVGIETAGNLNYLLTDKTGTLTLGKLKVDEIILSNLASIKSIDNTKIKDTLYKSLYFNNSSNYDELGNPVGGNSTDKSLLSFIKEDLTYNPKIIKYEPFNSQKKYSYCILEEEKKETFIKGAPEKLIKECTKCINEQGEERYFVHKGEVINKLQEHTRNGSRVIALVKSNTFHITNNLTNLVFIGLVIIKDQIRPEAAPSIRTIKKAGITPIMITGDDIATATYIAKETHILTSKNEIAMTSTELNSYTDDQLASIIKDIRVVARALPKDKSRLVKILENLNYVVGMTGDGVNDAPALKKADVGFAMGSGTEVAKEASDIVILDDNIESITKAILYGRTILKSIRKFIIFQLSLNICAIMISIIGPFIGIETPITIVQMLWINMIMDTFAGIAFSYEPPLEEYMEEAPLCKKTSIIDRYMKSEFLFAGIYQAIICILFLKLPIFKTLIRTSPDNKYLMTAYFSLFVFMGVFNTLNARTKRINVFANLKKNKPFIIIISFILITQLCITYKGGNLFRTYGLTWNELFLVLTIALTIVPLDWLRKYILKNKNIV